MGKMNWRGASLALFFAAFVAVGQNLVKNPGFEEGLSGWIPSKEISLSDDAYSGKRALKVVPHPAGRATVFAEVAIDQKTPAPLEFAFWEKSVAGAVGKNGLIVHAIYDDGKIENLFWQFSVSPVESDAWVFKWYVIQLSRPVKSAKIMAHGKNTGTLLVDDAYIGPVRRNLPPEELAARKRPVPVTVAPEKGSYGGFPARFQFLDISPTADVIAYDSPDTMPLELNIRYKVTAPAPITISSDWGSQRWSAFNFTTAGFIQFYSDEKISLGQMGERECLGKFKNNVGLDRSLNPIQKGNHLLLVGAGTEKTFNINAFPEGIWLNYFRLENMRDFYDPEKNPPIFLVANLEKYSIQFTRLGSDRKNGGDIWAELTLTDKDRQGFPICRADVTAKVGDATVRLVQKFDLTGMPTGLFVGKAPEGVSTENIAFAVAVKVQEKNKTTIKRLVAAIGEGQGETAMKLPVYPEKLDFSGWKSVDYVSSRVLDHGRAGLESFISTVEKSGLNAMTVEMLPHGQAAYNSDIATRKYADWDPLAATVEIARKHHVRVAAEVTLFHRYDDSHPEWRGVDRSGKTMEDIFSPFHPEVQKYYIDIVSEIARNYDIDAIYVDYIRCVGAGYSERERAAYREKFGRDLMSVDYYDPEITAWKMSVISDYLKDIKDAVAKIKPNVKIMTYAWEVYNDVNSRAEQDLGRWLRNAYADDIQIGAYAGGPYVYRATCRALKGLKTRNAFDGRSNIYAMMGVSETIGLAACYDEAVELLKEQVRISRQEGLDSVAFFNANYLWPYMEDVGGLFARPDAANGK